MITLALVLHIAYGFALCLIGLMVTTFWTLIQEWIEVVCAVTSITTTAMFLKWIHDDTEMADQYILKLKAELAAKDSIIAELKLVAEESSKKNLEEDSDSDYDPDEDEY